MPKGGIPPFPYGPDRPSRGRPKGSQNRVSKTLKEAILLAAEEVGNNMASAAAEKGEQREGGLLGYLTMVASTDVKSFCALLGRVLPMEVTGAEGGALTVEIVRLSERTDANPTA